MKKNKKQFKLYAKKHLKQTAFDFRVLAAWKTWKTICNIACMTQPEKVYCNYYPLILYLIYIQMTQDSSIIVSHSLF